MRLRILAVLLLLPTLAACSDASAGADATSAEEKARTAWRADVEEALGTEVVDLDAIARQAALDCQRTDTAAWIPTLALSGDLATSATDVTRIGLEHACPRAGRRGGRRSSRAPSRSARSPRAPRRPARA